MDIPQHDDDNIMDEDLPTEESENGDTEQDDMSLIDDDTPQPDVIGERLLWSAAVGDDARVLALINQGANLEFEIQWGATPLCMAISRFHPSTALLLLQHGANPNHEERDGSTPLFSAISLNQIEVTRALLDFGADIEHAECSDRYTNLMNASFYGHEEIVKLLLQRGANVHHRGDEGRTALFAVSEDEDLRANLDKVIVHLLEHGANLEEKDNSGRTPLSHAAFHGNDVVVQKLLDEGADIQHQDDNGMTSLMISSWNSDLKDVKVVQLLLDHGANTDVVCSEGKTHLSYAICGGNLELTRLLLDRGADILHRDNNGQSPLYYVLERNERESNKGDSDLEFVYLLVQATVQKYGDVHTLLATL